jgi:hypothetical protein
MVMHINIAFPPPTIVDIPSDPFPCGIPVSARIPMQRTIFLVLLAVTIILFTKFDEKFQQFAGGLVELV